MSTEVEDKMEGEGDVKWDFGEETLPVEEEEDEGSSNGNADDLENSDNDNDSDENQSQGTAGSETVRSTDEVEGDQAVPVSPEAGPDGSTTGPEAVLEFYQPVKIPAFLFLCAGFMIFFEEGAQITNEWYGGGPKATVDEVFTARTMLFFFGIWICGFVLSIIQYLKFVAMLLNKYVYPSLYQSPGTSRLKIVLAMIATKVASAVWKFETLTLVCDGKNDDYPACEKDFLYRISYRLSLELGCEYDPNRALCRRLLLQVPMMFLALFSFIFGKFIIPALIRRFRRVEEAALADLANRARATKRED